MLRVLIVDDEPWARTELRLLLAERSDATVVGEADSVDSAVVQLRAHDPHLIFLDIRLRGESGFDVFDRVDVRCHVVFLTAYDNHALRAFEVDALDYLVKPIRPEQLERALSRALDRCSETPNRGAAGPTSEQRVFLRETKGLRECLVSDIVFVQAAEAYTEVHLRSGEVVLVRERLHRWEDRLPTSFVRVHRSTLVNLHMVERLILRDRKWQLQLRGVDRPLVVSRRLAQLVKARLNALEASRARSDASSHG